MHRGLKMTGLSVEPLSAVDYLDMSYLFVQSSNLAVFSNDGALLKANPGFASITGCSLAELEGLRIESMFKQSGLADICQKLQNEMVRDVWSGPLNMQIQGRPDLDVFAHIGYCRKASRYYMQIYPLPARVPEDESWKRLAFSDELTGLPNYRKFREDAKLKMQNCRTSAFALIFIDIDNFKEINDQHGHMAGDRVLKESAKRLSDILAGKGAPYRKSGDEFLLILDEIQDMAEMELRIQRGFYRPFDIGNCHIHVQISMGTSIYSEIYTTVDMHVDAADQAMYRLKNMRKSVRAK